MTTALVSILIPCFNAETYIAAAVESALRQTHGNIEVIVYDDGSTDSSRERLIKFANDSRIRVESGPNLGGNAARNRLLALARGEYIQFLDADDILHEDKIKVQLDNFSPTVDMVFCEYQSFTITIERDLTYHSFPIPHDDLTSYFIANSVITMLPLHRKKHLIEVGGFRENLRCCQEYELHYRLARKQWKCVKKINTCLCYYRKTPNSVSSNQERIFAQKLKLLLNWFDDLKASGDLSSQNAHAIFEMVAGCGRQLARRNQPDFANQAFAFLRSNAPEYRLPGKFPMQILYTLLGPVKAERMRRLFRA
jgi:glycosyltransferase involved in cell wall biosynthesis